MSQIGEKVGAEDCLRPLVVYRFFEKSITTRTGSVAIISELTPCVPMQAAPPEVCHSGHLRCNMEGTFRPKCGGVNCKGRDWRVEKMANVGIRF